MASLKWILLPERVVKISENKKTLTRAQRKSLNHLLLEWKQLSVKYLLVSADKEETA